MKILYKKFSYRLSPIVETHVLVQAGFTADELTTHVSTGDITSNKNKSFNRFSENTTELKSLVNSITSDQHSSKRARTAELVWITGLNSAYIKTVQKSILENEHYLHNSLAKALCEHELPEFRDSSKVSLEDLEEMFEFDIRQINFLRNSSVLKDSTLAFHSNSLGLHIDKSQISGLGETNGLIAICHPIHFITEVTSLFSLVDNRPTTFPGYWIPLMERYNPTVDMQSWAEKSNHLKAIDIWKLYYERALTSAKNVSGIVVYDCHHESELTMKTETIRTPVLDFEPVEISHDTSDYVVKALNTVEQCDPNNANIFDLYRTMTKTNS